MARIINNIKGFKVIEISSIEMFAIGCGNICDHCEKTSENGYYVAVLNRWFCPACYEEWRKHASPTTRGDLWVESKNFDYYKMLLGIMLES